MARELFQAPTWQTERSTTSDAATSLPGTAETRIVTTPMPAANVPHSRRAVGGIVKCGWCDIAVTIPARGRVPKWCSDTCRHRAWEQRRAAESGLSAVEVVDREVEVVRTITTAKRVQAVAPSVVAPRDVADWSELLHDLADRLDRGRIYDRDVRLLAPPLTALLDAFSRRCR